MEVELTEEELEEFKRAFKVLNIEGDNKTTIKDLNRVMRDLNRPTSEDVLQDKINEVDSDGNGTIEFEEFLVMMFRKFKDKNDTLLTEAFRVYAKDNADYITIDNLREVMTRLRQRLTEEQLEEMFHEVDFDGDGQISYADFVAVMTTNS